MSQRFSSTYSVKSARGLISSKASLKKEKSKNKFFVLNLKIFSNFLV